MLKFITRDTSNIIRAPQLHVCVFGTMLFNHCTRCAVFLLISSKNSISQRART